MFNEIEQLIDELIETIGKIRKNRETNASAVKEQKILVENEIQEVFRYRYCGMISARLR
jgi:hypothetical protein